MTLLLLLLTLAATQAALLAAPWTGGLALDPTVCLAAFAGLYWPRRTLPLAALALGWGRAVVLLEPAGGQILCAWVALMFVAAQRTETRQGAAEAVPWTRFVIAAFLAAAAWMGAGWLLGMVLPNPLQAGRELFVGVIVAIPVARLARGAACATGWAAAT